MHLCKNWKVRTTDVDLHSWHPWNLFVDALSVTNFAASAIPDLAAGHESGFADVSSLSASNSTIQSALYSSHVLNQVSNNNHSIIFSALIVAGRIPEDFYTLFASY